MDKNENKFSADPGAFWDTIRRRKHDQSFPAVTNWIRNTNKLIREAKTRKRNRRRKLTWLSISFLFLFFIVSCTYRVERVKSCGSLINFGIDKQQERSFQKLSSIQQSFTFTCYEFLQPGQRDIASFIFFLPANEQEKLRLITAELKSLNGVKKININPVNYKVKESLFLTFLHKTLMPAEPARLKDKDLTRYIRATLERIGLGSLSINVSNDNGPNVSFIPAGKELLVNKPVIPDPDSLNLKTAILPGDSTRLQTNIRSDTPAGEKLQIFNWLLGTWSVKYVPQQTYHYWKRINDSSLVCFIIKYEDDEPGISIGFSIKYSAEDSAILLLRGIEWKFLSANNNEIRFRNETTPKSANVKWSPDNEKKSWQSVISGEQNLEIVNLDRSENAIIENIVKDFVKKNPDKIKL